MGCHLSTPFDEFRYRYGVSHDVDALMYPLDIALNIASSGIDEG